MYLGRAKKTLDELEQPDFDEIHANQVEQLNLECETSNTDAQKSVDAPDGFKPEELPDGACFRLKTVNMGSDDSITTTRKAEYIGSFSVNGEDQTTRTEFVQKQLEKMHAVEKSKKVMLVLSISGVKVACSKGESVYMAHALKRISYAACDPEHRQFAFLAREPKGHINIQFCHAFITQTPEQAEELNTLIGNAFKMAYAKQKTQQPTFNEIIERQLAEQKIKFEEYQEQASRALQARLTEIATPTALARMEMRRQSSSDDLLGNAGNTSGPASPSNVSEREYVVGKNKVWYSLGRFPQHAKQAVERVQHRSPIRDGPARSDSPTFSKSPKSRPVSMCGVPGSSGGPSCSHQNPPPSAELAPKPKEVQRHRQHQPYQRSSSASTTLQQHQLMQQQHQTQAYNQSYNTQTQHSNQSHNNQSHNNQSHNNQAHLQQQYNLSQTQIQAQQSSHSGVRKSDPVFAVTKRNSGGGVAPGVTGTTGHLGGGQSGQGSQGFGTGGHLSPAKSPNFSHSNSNSSSPAKRNSSPHLLGSFQNFQVVTIRESLENNVSNSNRFKGSPVTALKDEIDRRFSTSSGGMGTLDSGLGWGLGDELDSLQRNVQSPVLHHHYDNEDQSQAPATPSKMLNRPLPALPTPTDVAYIDHRASPKLRNWTSLDDDVIPNQSRSTLGGARMRDSPKRRPQRPQSEVILDSKLSAYNSGLNGAGLAMDQPGVYIYGFKSQTQNELSSGTNLCNGNTNQNNSNQSHINNLNISPHFLRKANIQQKQREVNGVSTSQVNGGSTGTGTSQQRYSPKVNNSDQPVSPKGNNLAQMTGYDNMHSLVNGKSSPPMHFQNGGLVTNGGPQNGTETLENGTSTKKKEGGGLESLMGLDRSHIEDETLRHACWYQAGIPRDVALEILQQEDIGSFIVRDSSTHPGCYALSVRVPKFENPSGISHYLILKTARGVKLKGLDKEWKNLIALVTHHTVMPEMLPCTLRLPRDTNNPAFKDVDKDDKEEDPDYQRLADFSSMMEALKQ